MIGYLPWPVINLTPHSIELLKALLCAVNFLTMIKLAEGYLKYSQYNPEFANVESNYNVRNIILYYALQKINKYTVINTNIVKLISLLSSE